MSFPDAMSGQGTVGNVTATHCAMSQLRLAGDGLRFATLLTIHAT